MADKKFSKTTFGKTYYPITQNDMSSTRFKKFTGNKEDKKNSVNRDQLDKYHKDLKEKLYKENVRPSEIAKLDKEYKARMKRANDDLQYKLSNRAGMKEARKKQKNTIPDTGSAFAKGGKAGYKDGKSVARDKRTKPSRTKGSWIDHLKNVDFSKSGGRTFFLVSAEKKCKLISKSLMKKSRIYNG